MAEPTLVDLVRELRQALGLFDGAMPVTPKEAWEEALSMVHDLTQGQCWSCHEKNKASHIGGTDD